MPALAQCSAICAPIVPAPRTATELIVMRASVADAVDEEVDDGVGVRGERIAAAAQDPVGRHFVERAEEHLGGGRGLMSRRKSAGAWPSAIVSRIMPR